LLKPFAGDAIQIFEQPASRFAKDDDTVHFGYRDNISQPRIEGVTYKHESSAPGRIPIGDILLGPSYRNSRGSSPIADLPIALAQNGTYAALRVIEAARGRLRADAGQNPTSIRRCPMILPTKSMRRD
jgi:hypothetical protein